MSLVGASGDALSRLRRSETDATRDAVLEAAVTLLGSQLPLDPRRRAISLSGEIILDVLNHRVQASIRWDSNKLDLNAADLQAIRHLLTNRSISTRLSSAVLTAVERARKESQPLHLISDLGLSQQDEACIASLVTVFGGRPDYDPNNSGDETLIGRPAAGSRLMLNLSLPEPDRAGLTLVVLVTGDPQHPIEVLDWMRTTGHQGEEVCHDV